MKTWVRVRRISELKVGQTIKEISDRNLGRYIVGRVTHVTGDGADYDILLLNGFPHGGSTCLTLWDIDRGDIFKKAR